SAMAPDESVAEMRAEETTSAPTWKDVRRPASAGLAQKTTASRAATRMCHNLRSLRTLCNRLAAATGICTDHRRSCKVLKRQTFDGLLAQERAHLAHQTLAQRHVHPESFQGLRDRLLRAFDGVCLEERLHRDQVPAFRKRAERLDEPA